MANHIDFRQRQHVLHPEGQFHALRTVCCYFNEIENDLYQLRALLFQNVRVETDSWQRLSRTDNPKLAKERWNRTRLIEVFILDMEPNPYKYRNEIAAIAHVIEYYLFKISPSIAIYARVDDLCARINILLNTMFKRVIMIRQERAWSRLSCNFDNDNSHFAEAA